MKNTNWTNATTDPNRAMVSLLSCIQYGHNAWIEVQENGEQSIPIMMPNPELNNPFNWTSSYGILRGEKEMENHPYHNKTEEDLTYNWISAFGTKEAVEAYMKDGTILPGLINGEGVHCPVRIKDANWYRREITGDNYEYGSFVSFWKPKDDIPYNIPDKSIKKVFVVCYDDKPFDKTEAIRKASVFLAEYADYLEEQERENEEFER